jgi:hypothetical protein
MKSAHTVFKAIYFHCSIGLSVIRSHKYPNIPATSEAMRIAIFDCVISSGLSNARSVMKIDIVKPIPPSSPTPISCFHFKSCGNAQSPSETVMKLERKIPSGLPTINPAKIPMLLACVKPVCQPLSMVMQVLAKANNGKIKNATGL